MSWLCNVPWWYWLLAVVWSGCQGARGVVEQRHQQNSTEKADPNRKMTTRERVVILYAHDFAFRFVCTFAGFVALCFAWSVGSGIDDPAALEATTATALVVAFFVAVVGVGGQFHYLILLGKWPK